MNNTNLIYTNTISPLYQFEIRDFIILDAPLFGNLHLSITNITLYLSIGSFLVLNLKILGNNYDKLIMNSWTVSLETIYATIHSIVINQINARKSQIYFPLIYSLFIFILIYNLIGMIPYSFASSSHFILAFSLSLTTALGATILWFQTHGLQFYMGQIIDTLPDIPHIPLDIGIMTGLTIGSWLILGWIWRSKRLRKNESSITLGVVMGNNLGIVSAVIIDWQDPTGTTLKLLYPNLVDFPSMYFHFPNLFNFFTIPQNIQWCTVFVRGRFYKGIRALDVVPMHTIEYYNNFLPARMITYFNNEGVPITDRPNDRLFGLSFPSPDRNAWLNLINRCNFTLYEGLPTNKYPIHPHDHNTVNIDLHCIYSLNSSLSPMRFL